MDELKIVAKIKICHYNELQIQEKKLIDSAKEATKQAYAPYSGFHVGAAVLLQNGEIVSGNNQENAAYPSGLCAERTAMFYANASHPDQIPVAIAVAAYTNGHFKESFITPCGSCRQALLETENRYKQPLKVYLYGKKEICLIESIRDLMPLAFGGDELEEKK